FLVFAETRKRMYGSHLVLLFPGDPVVGAQPVRFGYRGRGPGFAPTDAAELPDGRVAVLHRRFSVTHGFSAAITILDPKGIAKDSVVTGKPVAFLRPPLTVDNMEALAIDSQGGRTVLWIASDDNYFVAERTLLMAFELPAGV
ncbi:MAG: esterase-like activity of phytase family protein, partial [Sphingomonas oligoaromativorans]